MRTQLLGEASLNRINETATIELIGTIFAATGAGDATKAVALLEQLERDHGRTVNYAINGPGCYIETGDITNNTTLVQKGIDLSERTIQKLTPVDRSHGLMEFNRGNGYYCLYKISRRTGVTIDYYDCPWLQAAKLAYDAAMSSPDTTRLIRIQAVVNLANVYDTLGRTVEAIRMYEKALILDRTFPMALANLGKALYFFSAICGKYRIATIVQAYQFTAEALANEEGLQQIGGFGAVDNFRKQLTRIESRFADKTILRSKLRHSKLMLWRLSKHERTYLTFCYSKRLFLNFHIHFSGILCAASTTDDISISLIEKVGKESEFFFYSKYINQMKEDYSTARFLLFQSTRKRPSISKISSLTRYVDTLDYVNNNLYVGMLKAAFNRAYSILDKIAVFLDFYLGLNTKGKIYFTSFWSVKKDGKWVVRDEIRQLNNQCLLGLCDANRDLRSGLSADIIALRNASEHDHLSVTYFDTTLTEREQATEIVISIEKLQERTVDLMLIVKSCICNLVNFVNMMEEKKRPTSGLIAPMTYLEQLQL